MLFDDALPRYVDYLPDIESSIVFSCCTELIDSLPKNTTKQPPDISHLQQLCRLAIRRCVSTGDLFSGTWIDTLSIPSHIRNYLLYDPLPLFR
jgi:hypothetical protein